MHTILKRIRRVRSTPHVMVKKGGIESAMEDLSRIEICHVTATTTSECTLYTIYIQNARSGRSWVVHRRYTDFVTLRTRISAVLAPFQILIHNCIERFRSLEFPSRIAFTGKRVIQTREITFLRYLRQLHTLLMDPEYGLDIEIKRRCHSILRGFFGSMDVMHPSHADYFCIRVTSQARLHTSQRKCILRCGELDTVIEEEFTAHPTHSTLDENSFTLDESYASSRSIVEEHTQSDPSIFSLKTKPLTTSKAYGIFFPRKLTLCQQAALA